MDVALPLPKTAAPEEVLAAALARLQTGGRVAMATVLKRKGSAPSTPGQKLALLAADEAIGTVGGGAVEKRVLEAMLGVISGDAREPQVLHYDLGVKLGMCCGGSVEILVEVLQPAVCVVIVGAGHVGGALAPLLANLGFRVTVCDARDDVAARFESSSGMFLHTEHDDPDVRRAAGDPSCAAALVMTHDHQLDQAAIEWALRERFAFVGGVGSLAKAHRTRARLEAKGFSAEDVERMRMPLGIEISARLPSEIAVAIAGELVKWRAQLLHTDRRHRKHEHASAAAEE